MNIYTYVCIGYTYIRRGCICIYVYKYVHKVQGDLFEEELKLLARVLEPEHRVLLVARPNRGQVLEHLHSIKSNQKSKIVAENQMHVLLKIKSSCCLEIAWTSMLGHRSRQSVNTACNSSVSRTIHRASSTES